MNMHDKNGGNQSMSRNVEQEDDEEMDSDDDNIQDGKNQKRRTKDASGRDHKCSFC